MGEEGAFWPAPWGHGKCQRGQVRALPRLRLRCESSRSSWGARRWPGRAPRGVFTQGSPAGVAGATRGPGVLQNLRAPCPGPWGWLCWPKGGPSSEPEPQSGLVQPLLAELRAELGSRPRPPAWMAPEPTGGHSPTCPDPTLCPAPDRPTCAFQQRGPPGPC